MTPQAQVRLSDASVLTSRLLDLISSNASARQDGLRALKADPVVGWERFATDAQSRKATRRRLTPGFFKTLDRVAEEMSRRPRLRNSLLEPLADLHGIRFWIEKTLERRLGQAAVRRFRAACFAKQHGAHPGELAVYLTHQCNTRCSYCFALQDMAEDKSYITRENFLKILDWMQGQPYSLLYLLGGEPTIHPNFVEFLGLAADRGFPVHFSTNNLFSQDVLDGLTPKTAFNIKVNAMEPEHYRGTQWARFEHNLAETSRRGIENWLRYNIYSLDQAQKWHFLFDLCRKYSIKRVNFALTFPIGGNRNTFVPTEKFRAFAKTVVRFVLECRERDLDPVITKSFPICYFEPEDQPLLMEVCRLQRACSLHQNDYTYNLTVRPDLSLDPCVALKWKRGNLLDFKNREAVGELLKDDIQALERQPLFAECPSCPIYPLNVCKGACLAYKENQEVPS